MKILIPGDEKFDLQKCKNLYNEVEQLMNNSCSFYDIVYNSHFYSFYKNSKLAGCIYVTEENKKLFLNGFSVKKNHKFNIEAVNKVLSFYNCSMYAKTKNRTAQILLVKCGFKLIYTNSNGIKFYKKEK